MRFADRDCVPCKGGVPPLDDAKIAELRLELHPAWSVVDRHHLTREVTFPDFARALAAANQLGALAEQQGHHPDLFVSWGLLRVDVWTHAIDGLTESDFVFAAKADRVLA